MLTRWFRRSGFGTSSSWPGLRVLLGALGTCRNEGVARSYTYPLTCIRFTVAAIVNSALSLVSGVSRSPI